MFCDKCGKEIKEGTGFCPACGAPVTSSGRQQKIFSFDQTRGNVFYVTLVLAVLECIFPFMTWVTVPLYNSIGSFFGASGDISSYSLFGYTGTIQDQSMFTSVVILIFCFGTLAAIICNILYIIKGWKNVKGYGRYGRTAALLMMIVSLAFLAIMGLTALLLKLIKITAVPFLLFAASLVNYRLIKKL